MGRFVVPEVRFAQRDGVHIAYQCWGEGDETILLIPEWAVAGEAAWEHPGHVRSWRFYGSLGRVIRFDRSGVGSSDRVGDDELASPEVWAADALAVLDAEGVRHASVMGEAFGAQAAIVLAARHPERVSSLQLMNAFARLCRDDDGDHPFGADPGFGDLAASYMLNAWGTGAVVGSSARNLFADGDYASFCGRLERVAASKSTAAAIVRGMYESDVRELLDSISASTVVTRTEDIAYVPAACTFYVADRIRGARYLEAAASSFYASEERRQLLTELIRPGLDRSARERSAVLFTDIVNSTIEASRLGDTRWRELLEDVDDVTAREVEHHAGRIVTRTGDGALAQFLSASDAVDAARAIVRAARVLGVEVRIGIHVGDVERRADGDLAGLTVHAAARVTARAGAGEILVSSLAAAELDDAVALDDRGTAELKGLPGEWSLAAVR